MTLTNMDISELLAGRADKAEGHYGRALRKASRAALYWEEEAAALLADDRELTELYRVGPKIAGLLNDWFEEPPEIPEPDATRQGFMTNAHARAVVAEHPEWRTEIRGDLQMHTVYSDGSLSIEEMANACIERGYEFIGITDHSQGLKIAGGMDERELTRQTDEIVRFNADLAMKEVDFEVLTSMEMNLAPDGSGDMDPEALAELDLVLGSFHSQLRKKEDQTDRYIAGIRNPDIQVLGHPRGRQYNFRLGLTADWPKVFAEAARWGRAVEIDCHPNRQDLNVELAKLALEAGCVFSIGTDSHYAHELDFISIGLATAIEAGIPQDRVINFAPADAVREWAASVRKMRRRKG
jgi:histidinol phosphatase-like PHP family hydrolase